MEGRGKRVQQGRQGQEGASDSEEMEARGLLMRGKGRQGKAGQGRDEK